MNRIALPGETVAVIEEFEGKEGIYVDDGSLRALTVGEIVQDFKKRLLRIKPVRPKRRLPSVGDVIIGQVVMAQTNISVMKIHYINDQVSYREFEGVLSTRLDDSRNPTRRRMVCKTGDLVRARVISTNNASIHLAFKEEDDGVIRASCSVCGESIRKIGTKTKCRECGNIEDRKLAADFRSP
ncbi:MAG: exosome complex RNA-binding protein Csl4 [Candidatus Thorarchaeota archaeon]